MTDHTSTLRPRCGFLHIPKTAGISVRTVMREAYGNDAFSALMFDEVLFGGFNEWHTMAPHLQATILHGDQPVGERDGAARAVAAHMSYRSITRLVDAADVLTVLREPRARLLSHHLYWAMQSDAGAADYGTYQTHRLTFDGLKRFLANPAAAHQADNLQVRMLADIDIDPSRPLSPADRDAAIESARRALGTLGCTTFVESPTFWRDLTSFIGVTAAEKRENVTDGGAAPLPFRGAQLDRETIELLDARSAADSVIYREVVATALGIDTAAAADFADAAFVSQVERYGRLAARAEHAPIVSPAGPPEPPAPAGRRRTGLGILARRLLRP